MQGNLQQNLESARLAESLLDLARVGDAPLDHCFLTTSGAMATCNHRGTFPLESMDGVQRYLSAVHRFLVTVFRHLTHYTSHAVKRANHG